MTLSAGVAAAPLPQATSSQPRPKDADAERCWPGVEAQNPDIKGRKPPILPADLADAVTANIAMLKLCVDESGKVARVLVLRSSGSRKVDAFFQKELSKWIFRPVTRDGKPAESVANVAIALDSF